MSALNEHKKDWGFFGFLKSVLGSTETQLISADVAARIVEKQRALQVNKSTSAKFTKSANRTISKVVRVETSSVPYNGEEVKTVSI